MKCTQSKQRQLLLLLQLQLHRFIQTLSGRGLVDDYDFGGVMSQCLFNGLLLLLKDRALNCGGGGGSNSNYDSTKHCYEPNYDTRTSESTRALLLLLLLVETHNIYCQ